MGDGRLTADRPGHEMANIDNDVDEVSARLEQLEMALADLQSGMEEPWSVSMPDEDEQGHDTLTGLAPDYIDSDDTLRSIGPNSNQRLEIYGFEAADAGDIPIKRVSDGVSDVDWTPISSLSVYYADTAGTAMYVVDISDHDHGELMGLSDDDHKDYWRKGGDYTRHYGTGIGIDLGVHDLIREVVSISNRGVKLFSIGAGPGCAQLDGVQVTDGYRGLFNAAGSEMVDFSTHFDVNPGELYVGGLGPFDMMTIDVPDGSGAMKTIKVLGMET